MDAENHVNISLVKAFIAEQIFGGCGFAILIFTAAISRHVTRFSTWFSFCISWTFFFCPSFSLLFLAGQQFRTSPTFALCLAQASLVYAAPPLAVSTTLSLVIHIWFNMRFIISRGAQKINPITVVALLIAPYVIWTGVVIGNLAFALQHPETVGLSPNGTYCILKHTALPKLTSGFVVVAGLAIVAIEAIIVRRLYQNWALFEGISRSITLTIRVIVFSSLGLTAVAIGIVYVVTWSRGGEYDVAMASLPAGACVIFGSQMDLIHVWMFWRRKSANKDSTAESSIPTDHSFMIIDKI